MQISAIFEETANQEKGHAKRFFKFLEGGDLEITASFPAGVIGATEDNLEESANGEHYEHDVLYPEFAKVAVMKGFLNCKCEKQFFAEKQHERFRTLLDNLNDRRDAVAYGVVEIVFMLGATTILVAQKMDVFILKRS